MMWLWAVLCWLAPVGAQTTPPAVSPDSPVAPPAPAAPLKQIPRPFTWTPLTFDLPASIKVLSGEAVNNDGWPVKAWIAAIDYTDRSLLARAIFSTTTIGRESTSSLAAKSGALVALNGGYFDMKAVPSKTFSLVMSNGQILAKNVAQATRPNGKYFLTRGAFGIRADRTFDISWITHFEDGVYSLPTPLPNTPNFIAPAPTRETAQPWANMVEAMGGGPVLLKHGEIQDLWQAEVFPSDLSIRTHPRSAVGWTAQQQLVLFVCDGRQPGYSMGLTTRELAQAMKELGCLEALNLDGGGSTTFVVKNQVLNKPSDGRERNVTSILALVPNPELQAIQ
jgi:hypothetical protein